MKLSFIGTGNMGSAIARAVCTAADAGSVYVSNRSLAKAESLAAELGCHLSGNVLGEVVEDEHGFSLWRVLSGETGYDDALDFRGREVRLLPYLLFYYHYELGLEGLDAGIQDCGSGFHQVFIFARNDLAVLPAPGWDAYAGVDVCGGVSVSYNHLQGCRFVLA